jgi:uncharacterized protein YaeQ
MALKATIFKAQLGIADMDRPYYGDHAVTVARHPSETDERMLVRLIAFALHADDALAFGKGLSSDDEPDLWRRDLTGAIELWIDVGLPDEKRVRKACGRAARVFIYAYGARGADLWWTQNAGALERLRNLTVIGLRYDSGATLAALASRSMDLRFTVQEGQIWITDGAESVAVELVQLMAPGRD